MNITKFNEKKLIADSPQAKGIKNQMTKNFQMLNIED